jgi:predicted dehydrogenase
MALTLEECNSMIEASVRTGKKLMIGQICRYTPGFMLAKGMIVKGEIGELFFVESEYAHDYANITGVGNWRLDPVRLRHPFLGGGCHAVDLLRWIAGNPYEVAAYSSRKMLKNWPMDDCLISIMKFPGDVLGKVFMSAGCKRNYTMRSAFYGSKGTIIVDNTSPYLTLYKQKLFERDRMFEKVEDQAIALTYPVSIDNHNTAGEINELVDIILHDKPVVTDGIQGASTVAVCLAAIDSAAAGCPVEIKYDFKCK